MKGAILILTEEEQGSLRKVSREALGLGRAMAGKQGSEILAVVFGEKRILAEEALQYGRVRSSASPRSLRTRAAAKSRLCMYKRRWSSIVRA